MSRGKYRDNEKSQVLREKRGRKPTLFRQEILSSVIRHWVIL